MSTTARFSLAEYDRMAESGIFDGKNRRHLELVRGEVREKCAVGPLHESVVDKLNEWSFLAPTGGCVRVRTQNSLGLIVLESVLEPDIAWVIPDDYSRGRPTGADVLLVIEVAESSLAYDCGEKADLYASAGIKDYWVVNVPERCVEVRRDPGSGHYRSLTTYTGDDEVRPLAAPEVVLRPSMLWK